MVDFGSRCYGVPEGGLRAAMADYYPLLSRVIAELDKNTAKTRRGLYQSVRTGLLNQMRKVDPPPPESEITRERLALEEAIRKVEAEQLARWARKE